MSDPTPAIPALPVTSPSTAAPSMRPRSRLAIFLSSTSLDLKAHRTRVRQTVEKLHESPVVMDDFGAQDGGAIAVSLKELASAHIYVLLLGWRYGSIPAGETLSVTHLEYRAAKAAGLPRLIFLADPSTEADDGPDALFPAAVRDPEHAAQLRAFHEEVRHDRVIAPFTTPESLLEAVVVALHQTIPEVIAQVIPPGPLPPNKLAPRVVALAEMPRHGAFIGHEHELGQLLQWLTVGDEVGIFALKGMGGVGKTALAAEAVSRLASDTARFPGGVVWIACTGLTGASGLETTVERVAGLFGMAAVLAQQDPALRRQRLTEALGYRSPLLLALDNIEPGLDVEALLRTLAVRGHTILLLTARQHVAPQLLRAIEVLPLPARNAADLFAARLRQATGDTRPTDAERAKIAPLVEAVGGLPLAVELLAGFAGDQRMSLADLSASLAAVGIHAAAFETDPDRVITQVFDRSWQALSEPQQRLFASLSLLPESGFPRAAALALAMAASHPRTADALDREGNEPNVARAERDLAALVTHALVNPLEVSRLRLHQLLYQYAADQLAALGAASEQQLGAAMVAYWVAYARAHAGYQQGIAYPNYGDVDLLEAEADGLMAAAAYAHNNGLHREILALGHIITDAWDLRGRRGDLHRLLPWQMSAAQSLGDRREIQRATHELAVLDRKEGDYAVARATFEQALRLAEALGDKAAIRMEMHGLAAVAVGQGNVLVARATFEQALRLAEALGDKAAIQRETHELAALDARERHYPAARVGLEKALRLAEALGDKAAIRRETHELAVLDAEEGNYPAARVGLEKALRLAEALGDKAAIQRETHVLAVLDARERHYPAARAGLQEALRLARELGDMAAVERELLDLATLDDNERNR